MRTRGTRLKFATLASLAAAGPSLAQDCGWASAGDLDQRYASVRALGVFDLGSGPALYAGGEFNEVGGRWAPGIARLDGDRWTSVGGGTNRRVTCFVQFDDGAGPALYVGGEFTEAGGVPANSVARWDGVDWCPVGDLRAGVNALVVFDDGTGPALYAGGYFVYSWPYMTRYCARWDGKTWVQVGTLSGPVHALTVWDDGSGPALYAGGSFKNADGKSVGSIARWNGHAWSGLGNGVYSNYPTVFALAEFDDGTGASLYAGGSFESAGGATANGVARWDGELWSAVPGLDNLDAPIGVSAFAVHDQGSGLYFGGVAKVELVPPYQVGFATIWRWDGALVQEVASCQTEDTFVIAMSFHEHPGGSPKLYAGGLFDEIDGVAALGLAKYACMSSDCPADCDSSGSLDLFDYLCFINAFQAGAAAADCDQNGSFDLFDFACFTERFNQGCP